MRCSFCQNWQISQNKPEDIRSYDLPPEQVVEKAKELNIPTICFTYSEPIIFYEYMYATAAAGQKQNIRTAMVSNGFINKAPLQQLLPYVDAVKIDLKAFSNTFYEDICMGKLDGVLKTLRLLKESGKHFEIVVLIIPTLNDSTDELQKMCSWIYKNLGADIPLHFTRFIPAYKLTSLPMTPVKTLEKAYDIAKKNRLHFVYIGNVPGHKYNSTYCPHCEKRLIYRIGYEIKENLIKDGKCPFCSETIPGVWK